MVRLLKIEGARSPARVEVNGIVIAMLERPAARNEGIVLPDDVDLAPVLEELTGRRVPKVVGALFGIIVPAGPRRDVEARVSALEQCGALDVGNDIAAEMAVG